MNSPIYDEVFAHHDHGGVSCCGTRAHQVINTQNEKYRKTMSLISTCECLSGQTIPVIDNWIVSSLRSG